MEQDNSRNTMLFVVCAVLMLLAYQVFVLGPAQQRRETEAKARAAAAATNPAALPAGAPAVYVNREQALAQSPRIRVETPSLTGSISLKGARLDDLALKGYRQTI